MAIDEDFINEAKQYAQKRSNDVGIAMERLKKINEELKNIKDIAIEPIHYFPLKNIVRKRRRKVEKINKEYRYTLQWQYDAYLCFEMRNLDYYSFDSYNNVLITGFNPKSAKIFLDTIDDALNFFLNQMNKEK